MDNMREMRITFPTPQKLLTPGVVIVLSLLVAGFLGTALATDTVIGTLALHPQGVIHGRIWQLVTYPFLNGPCSLLFNGLIILFVGSAIEREWRTASFLWLWLTVSVVCAILWIMVSLLMGISAVGLGAHACGYGIIGVMGVLFRRQRFLFFFATLEAQHIAIGLIAIGVILSLPTPIALVWVAGALVGYGYIKVTRSVGVRSAVRSAPRPSAGKGQFVDID